MVDLNCYQGIGTNFTVLPATNDCNTNLGGPVVVNGCYSIVNQPLVSLFGRNNDFTLIAQWVSRFRLTFAICRGALSHTFVNAWVNGTLFAFPFENNVFFDSNNNTLLYLDFIILHTDRKGDIDKSKNLSALQGFNPYCYCHVWYCWWYAFKQERSAG